MVSQSDDHSVAIYATLFHGALAAAPGAVCLLPEFLIANYPIPFYLGGTAILIVVVVSIDTVTQIQTRLMSSQYESLIKKTKFGK